MKCRKAYGIMPVGENDRSAHVAQQKAPEVATPGLFYSVLGGWLNPKAGYQLFFSVQPFADVVGNYTCQNREKNDRSSLMRFTPFLYLSGGGSVVHYITGAEMPQEAISPCLSSKP